VKFTRRSTGPAFAIPLSAPSFLTVPTHASNARCEGREDCTTYDNFPFKSLLQVVKQPQANSLTGLQMFKDHILQRRTKKPGFRSQGMTTFLPRSTLTIGCTITRLLDILGEVVVWRSTCAVRSSRRRCSRATSKRNNRSRFSTIRNCLQRIEICNPRPQYTNHATYRG
jgi:hypothetical protein